MLDHELLARGEAFRDFVALFLRQDEIGFGKGGKAHVSLLDIPRDAGVNSGMAGTSPGERFTL